MTSTQFSVVMELLQRLEAKLDLMAARVDDLEAVNDKRAGSEETSEKAGEWRLRMVATAAAVGGVMASACYYALSLLHTH